MNQKTTYENTLTSVGKRADAQKKAMPLASNVAWVIRKILYDLSPDANVPTELRTLVLNYCNFDKWVKIQEFIDKLYHYLLTHQIDGQSAPLPPMLEDVLYACLELYETNKNSSAASDTLPESDEWRIEYTLADYMKYVEYHLKLFCDQNAHVGFGQFKTPLEYIQTEIDKEISIPAKIKNIKAYLSNPNLIVDPKLHRLCDRAINRYLHQQKRHATSEYEDFEKPVTTRTWGEPEDKSTAEKVIVAIHGWRKHSGSWNELGTQAAAQGIPVITYDQYGFGDDASKDSTILHKHDLRLDYMMFLREVSKRYKNADIHIVGHSMGGAIALTMAEAIEQDPTLNTRVKSVDCVAPALLQTRRQWLKNLFNSDLRNKHPFYKSSKPKTEKAWLKYLAQTFRQGYRLLETMINAFYAAKRLAERSTVNENSAKVRIYSGAKDKAVPLNPTKVLQEATAEDNAHFSAETLNGMDHTAAAQDKAMVSRLLDNINPPEPQPASNLSPQAR